MSRFSKDQPSESCLKDFYSFSTDIYPIGRLDKDSEGLLILTNDPSLNSQLLSPAKNIEKIYWCQVEGIADPSHAEKLMKGVGIRIKQENYWAKASRIQLKLKSSILPDRIPPIRVRKSIPTSWIEIGITEGKNRQVRHMMAAIGLPVLRLIRMGIGSFRLPDLIPGTYYVLSKTDINRLLSN